jgi:para-aminobenzoate synthetase component 1
MTAVTAAMPIVVHRILDDDFDPADVAVRFSAAPYPAVLESVCDTAGYGRFSLFACAPVAIVRADAGDPAAVRAALARIGQVTPVKRPASAADLPFVAGWIGCVPYEAGASLENVLRAGSKAVDHTPRLEFALYDCAVIRDCATSRWHVAGADLAESTTPAYARIEQLTRLLADSANAALHLHTDTPHSSDTTLPTPDVARDDYLRAIRRAQEYIAAGDIYQVNLTQRFTARTALTPTQIYLRLCAANPADFAALLPWGEHAIISASPELFLALSPDREVITRPIKGTRPRAVNVGIAATPVPSREGPGEGRRSHNDQNTQTDRAARAKLLNSEKDRAELNMIIDLLRNDLGRLCEFGSVQVLADADVETHPTVLHLVGTITGRLRHDMTPADLLTATLPGGSITGCPKIRAMQIIRELEPTPRGAYCGTIGYLGLDGSMRLNVAIRTMQYRAVGPNNGTLHLHAGGAIVADSDPDAEYAETLAKAEGMFRALGHTTAALDAAPAVR